MPRRIPFRDLIPASDEKRRPLIRALKVLVALVLLFVIVKQVHWQDYPVTDELGNVVMSPGVLSCLSNADLRWVAAALLVSITSLLIAGLRWRLLLGVQDVRVSITETLKLQLIGEFFSTVIPGMVGGDLIKAYFVMRRTDRKAHVLVSVFVDRLLGVCGMVAMAAAMLTVLWATGQLEGELLRLSAPSVGIIAAGSCAALMFLLSPRLRGLFHLEKLYSRLSIAEQVAHAGDAMRRYRDKPSVLASAFLASLVAQTFGSAFVVMLGHALGLELPWTHYFLHIPLIMIISAVPITPGGIGVMEQLYLLYFAAAGNPSQVLSLAVLVRVITLLGALPGGVVALFSGSATAKKAASPIS